MTYKEFFHGKNIAVVGLGPHGEMIADIRFILRLGADVTLHDMRSETRLQGHITVLNAAGLTKYHLGRVSPEELAKADLIIISPEISRKASFLRKADQAGVRIEYPDILFLKLVPAVTLIGIMGAVGKSTVAVMLYSVLKKSFSEYESQGLFFIDPDLPNGTLTHLKKIKAGDVVLARVVEEMLNEYHSARLSPHVAVITSLMSAGKSDIRKSFAPLEFQTYNNFIVAPDTVIDAVREQADFIPKAKMLRTKTANSSLVLQAAELFKVSREESQKVVDEFSGLKGRQEFVKKVAGIEFYNDSASVTPVSTLFALQNLSLERNIILILGGAYTGYDYGELINKIPEYARMIILLPGSGSVGIRQELKGLREIKFFQAQNLEDAVMIAKENGKKGDRVLFSPGCEAIGVHISRKERGEKFVKAVRGL